MCKIVSKYRKSKTFTGYKVVVVRRDYSNRIHYYSPLTGQEYKINQDLKPVSFSTIYYGFITNNWDTEVLKPGNRNFSKLMQRKTSVIISKEDVKTIGRLEDKEVIVKMTITKGLYNATMRFDRKKFKTIVGGRILSIKKLTLEEVEELNCNHYSYNF